ncbi:MAG: hypothetical protein SP1CHLAM54_07790 [Chlamydiia bacterium]|nr:hypothetical protein [Chlamydiia bacterium]MCH9615685.1 hypothetical protein [Chlamydiia bacterium]MCH9628912.1 hypothetical protein [Chlamydiia bacterium]
MAVPFTIGERTALTPGANDEWFLKDYAYMTAYVGAFGSAATAALGVCGVITAPVALPSSLVLGGISLLSWAVAYLQEGNYADPRDLLRMRDEALQVPLLESINTHGWDNLIRYEILTYPEVQAKFLADTASWDFKRVVDTFGWQTIQTRQLWTYDQAKSAFESTITGMSQDQFANYFGYQDFGWLVQYNLMGQEDAQNWIYYKSSLKTLDQLVNQFGWARLKAGDLVRPEHLRQKFHETTRLMTGVDFIQKYSLTDIGHMEDLGLIDSHLRAVLVGLVDHYYTSKGEIDRVISRIDRVYNAEMKALKLEKKESIDALSKDEAVEIKACDTAKKEALDLAQNTYQTQQDRILEKQNQSQAWRETELRRIEAEFEAEERLIRRQYRDAVDHLRPAYERSKSLVEARFEVEKERINAQRSLDMIPLDQQVTDLKAEINARYAAVQW